MKKIILIFLGTLIFLGGISGLVLEKIILSQMPKVLEHLKKDNIKISFSDVKGDSGFANTKLEFKNLQIETAKGSYQTDYISVKVSLFSLRTLEGKISGNQRYNQWKVKSEPILFKLDFGAEKKLTADVEKLSVSSFKEIAFFQNAHVDATLLDKQIYVSFVGDGISLPIVPFERFSEMNKVSFDVFYPLVGNEVVIEKSLFDFKDVYLSVQGRVQKNGFILNTQIRGWESVLDELTAKGFISEGKRKIINTTLKLLSVRGVLTAPLILKDGVLYVGKYPLMNLSENR